VDNGYFDAIYVDKKGYKDTGGKFRIVKNEMIEKYIHKPSATISASCLNVLVLPPSPYSAFMHDTTPEDWIIDVTSKLRSIDHPYKIRYKDDKQDFKEAVKECDAVLAFNSMGVMAASEMGRAVYDTHGIFRNYEMLGKIAPYYAVGDLKKYYKQKDYSLEEIADGDLECLRV
jgi:hypothetical protein